jgi:hypothetical protein
MIPDIFPDFLWLDTFAYPPIYAAGWNSAPAMDPFPGQLLQTQQEVLPPPVSDQNLQDGDENSINSVENHNTKEVPTTRQVSKSPSLHVKVSVVLTVVPQFYQTADWKRRKRSIFVRCVPEHTFHRKEGV